MMGVYSSGTRPETKYTLDETIGKRFIGKQSLENAAKKAMRSSLPRHKLFLSASTIKE